MKYRLESVDSAEIYSRSTNHPFRYGYPLDKAQCLEYFNQLSELCELHEGDVIADVGAASGWVDGALSVICDNLTIVVEDIDTDYLNDAQFNQVKKHFNNVRVIAQTNLLNYIIGTETESKLPDTTFDKIIINNAFHEFKKPGKILADLRKKLKPQGVLIICDVFSSRYKIRYAAGCNTKVETLNWLVKLAEKNGLFLYNRKAPACAKSNALIFCKNKRDLNPELSYASYNYEYLIDELELYNNVDTSYTNFYFDSLIFYKSQLKAVYPMLSGYLSDIVADQIDFGHKEAAYHISLKALELYPDDEDLLAAHAMACESNGYLQRSLEYYQKAAKLCSLNEYDDDIKRLNEEIAK